MSAPSNTQSPFGRIVAWLQTPSGIAAMFVIGLAIRLAFARGRGFPYDMASFGGWSHRLAERGPWNFYPTGGEEFFVDYPPGYLYVLWIVGMLADLVLGTAPPALWLKMPPILADLGLAALVMVAADRLAPSVVGRRRPVRPLAAAVILFNPAIIFISAVWGQADSVPTALVVGAFILLATGAASFRREAAGMALLAVALGTKPQTGFVLPMVALVLIWRHVRGSVVAAEDPRARSRAAWFGTLRLAALAGAGVVAGFLLFLPFRLYPHGAYDFYLHSAGQYRVTSVFAFNLWGAVEFWRPDSGNNGLRILGLPAVAWGVLLFAAIGGLVLARAWRALQSGQDEGRVLVFGSMALTLVGFAVVTRIHERYLFLPLALGAMLIGTRWMRSAFAALSALYFINVFYPYVYYLEFEKLPAPKLWGAFDAFYGTDLGGIRLRALSAGIAAVCLFIAWRGWRELEPDRIRAPTSSPPERYISPAGGFAAPTPSEDEPMAHRPWTLAFHPVGKRGAVIALGVFAVALLSRVAGLGHPPGMFFDEVYHARAGAEYIDRKEVFEYTHPPLAKEVMGASIRYLSGFSTTDGGALPTGVGPRTVTPQADAVVWARNAEGSSVIQQGTIDGSCELVPQATLARADIRTDAMVATPTAVLVAGEGSGGPVLIRYQGSSEVWRATLPAPAAAMSRAGERAYVVTTAGDLVSVSSTGDQSTVALGAGALSVPGDDKEVWVAFAEEGRVASWDGDGVRKAVVEVGGRPEAIVEPPDVDRVYVTVGSEILSIDTETQKVHSRVAPGAQRLGIVPETTAVWALDGTSLRVIEPHSAAVIGRTSLQRAPDVLSSESNGHRLLAIAGDRMECVGGRPQFAWRLGSAIFGAAIVALVFGLAMRLTGNIWAGLLGSLFVAVDGLAFTISRIAMNDSYTTAGLLGAWFCAISALRTWGRTTTHDPGDTPRRDRASTTAWLVGAGLCGGIGLASKWVALYALAGIGLLMLWDGVARGRESIWHVAGALVPSGVVIGSCLVALPLAIYVVSYIPYFSLGHSFADFARMQEDMFSYHSTLTASHPFGSPWWGWPFGYRAVFLYLEGSGLERSEIWTAPNLVVFFGGLVAMASIARRAFRDRSATLLLVFAAAAVQYLPWVLVGRVTFMYHYLPVVPFLALALGWFLTERLRGHDYERPITIGVVAAAVVMFLWLYPMLVGWQMPLSYLNGVREALPWVIP